MSRSSLVYGTLLLLVLIILLSGYYYIGHRSESQSFHSIGMECRVKDSFYIKGREPYTLVDSYLLFNDESGRIAVFDLKTNKTIELDSEALVNKDIWGFISYKGRLVEGICNNNSITFVDIYTGKTLRELHDTYPSINPCVSAYPFWAGDNYYAFNNGSYLSIASVDKLLTDSVDKAVLASFNSVKVQNENKEYLSSVIIHGKIIYASYSLLPDQEYVEAHNLTDNRLLYTRHIQIPGKIMYAGFIYQEKTQPLLWILYSNNDNPALYHIVIYNYTKEPIVVCNTSINNNGTNMILPLSINYRDIDNSGNPDMIFALLNQMQENKNIETRIVWIELTEIIHT